MSEPKDLGALFTIPLVRLIPGRVRKGLDTDLKAATDAGTALAASDVGLLRSLADQIDHLERQLRTGEAKAYDRVPLAQLSQTYHAIYASAFHTDAAGDDPFARAAAELDAELARARTTPSLDPEEPGPPH